MNGTVSAKGLKLDKGYGFLSVPGQPDVFFHSKDLSPELPFDERLAERRVSFDLCETAKGLRAANISPAE